MLTPCVSRPRRPGCAAASPVGEAPEAARGKGRPRDRSSGAGRGRRRRGGGGGGGGGGTGAGEAGAYSHCEIGRAGAFTPEEKELIPCPSLRLAPRQHNGGDVCSARPCVISASPSLRCAQARHPLKPHDSQRPAPPPLLPHPLNNQGTGEALRLAVEGLGSDLVGVNVVSCAVGPVTEGDVSLAAATGAVILAYNVKVSASEAVRARW